MRHPLSGNIQNMTFIKLYVNLDVKFAISDRNRHILAFMLKYLISYYTEFFKYYVKSKNSISISLTLNVIFPINIAFVIIQAKCHGGLLFSYSKFRTGQFGISDKVKCIVCYYFYWFNQNCYLDKKKCVKFSLHF